MEIDQQKGVVKLEKAVAVEVEATQTGTESKGEYLNHVMLL